MGNSDSVPVDGKYIAKKVIKKKNKQNYEEEYKKNNNNKIYTEQNHQNKIYTEQKHNYNINSEKNQYNKIYNNVPLQTYKKMEKDTSNNAIMQRNTLSDIYLEQNRQTRMMNYPTNSNNELVVPKANFENVEFTPYNFNDEINNFKKNINDEQEQFERDEKERRKRFLKEQKSKEDFLDGQIKNFELKYNPWEILGLEYNDFNIEHIKKAYKKCALKYHPDRAGDKYQDKFQLITQSYIYLLKKAEESDSLNIKINKKVEKMSYEDDINENVENIYVSKDKFDINQFNKIFDKYKVPSKFDKGYSNLEDNIEDNNINKTQKGDEIFGKKFNNDIFNAHFNESKGKKKSSAIIEYNEPIALDSSLNNLNTEFLGMDDIDDFGAVNSNNLSYTDYKKAHLDENLLIDVNKVKYKTYNSIDHLESERSKLSYEASTEDRKRIQYMERKKEEDESLRQRKQRDYDEMIEKQYKRINQKLLVHK